jgi:hypothetical protein
MGTPGWFSRNKLSHRNLVATGIVLRGVRDWYRAGRILGPVVMR